MERNLRAMRHCIPCPLVHGVVLVLWAGLAASAHGDPAAPPSAPATATSGSKHFSHHFHHYGHYRHYGHFHHNGQTDADAPADSGTGTDDDAQSFERAGRTYYWHTRNGHRFYSSRPEPGDVTTPDLEGGEDLDAPLTREERSQRAARMQHAQAHLAAVERRVARQRHLMHLRELAAKPKPLHKVPLH